MQTCNQPASNLGSYKESYLYLSIRPPKIIVCALALTGDLTDLPGPQRWIPCADAVPLWTESC